MSEKLKKINKNTQISFDEVTPPIILNKSHRNIFEAKIYNKTELNRDYESRISDYDFDSLNSEKKKELSSLEHSCPEITPLSKGNVLGNNLNVSLNESIICDSIEKSVFQNVLKFHENLPVNVSKVKSNDLLPYISPESENIGFEGNNYNCFNKNIKGELKYIENGHLISQNSNILSNMPLISSHSLNVLEPKSDTEVLSNFSKIETLNTTNEIYNHEIEKSILFKEQHTMKLMPLVSMSEVSKAQSKEKVIIFQK